MNNYFVRQTPNSLQSLLRKSYFLPINIINELTGKSSMIPPESMNFVGHGDFEQLGLEFKRYFIELGELQPDDRVLDVGCGIGRMAVPLTNYLSPQGEYWGVDIVKKGIKWCQRRISPKFSNFHFLHSNVYNKHYNAKGTIQAKDYQFPFEDSSFDFVFLTSVFTHMLTPDLENYLKEIGRVLKPGGRCLITFFLLNEESEKLVSSGKTSIDFNYQIDECTTSNKDIPEAATAYQEAFIRALFNKYNMTVSEPIHFGNWCEREQFLSYQDLVVARKN